MIMQLWVTLMLAILNSCTYRMGGSGNYGRWVRPFGVGFTVLLVSMLWVGFHWSLLLCAGLSAVLSTTYVKHKDTDAKWFNWLLVGLILSLAMIPYAWATGHWLGLILRTFVLGAAVCTWSELIGDAVLEELGRGFFIVVTLPLLFIF